MKNLKRKLLTITCAVGMMGLGYALPAKAFESKIPTDGKVIHTEVQELNNAGGDYTKTIRILENKIVVEDFDFNLDGKIDGRTIRQKFPDYSIEETDFRADGNIDIRATYYKDGSILYEEQLSDGSVRKELFK